MNKITLTTLILCLSAIGAHAQEKKFSGGMKYTTMSNAEPSDTDKKPIYNRKAEDAEDAADASGEESEEEAAEKTPEQSAWDKYKELAAGKAKKDETKEGSALPKAPEKPSAPETATKEETEKPRGFAAIINDYQRNKQKRSQMRSISFGTPEDLEINKPEIDTPSVESRKLKSPEVKKDTK